MSDAMPPSPTASLLIRVWIPVPYSRGTAATIDMLITRLTRAFGGCTFTKPGPAGEFRGRWRNDKGAIEQDRDVTMIVVDVDPSHQSRLFAFLTKIKRKIENVE